MSKKEKKTVTTTTTTTTVVSSGAKEIYDVFVLDRSGSMGNIWNSTVAGVNEYINKAKRVAAETGVKSFLSLLKFDDVFITVYNLTPIAEVRELDLYTDGPRGSTALNDAIGKSVNAIKAHLFGRETSDDVDVTITIFTDGYENASREFTHLTISSLLKHVQDVFKWTVVYVGAGTKDQVQHVSNTYNISASNTGHYDHNPVAAASMFNTLATSRSIKSDTYATTGLKTNLEYFSPPTDEDNLTPKIP